MTGPTVDSYDVIVLGAGPAGEVAAGRLSDGGLSVAVVERELVGGGGSYYGCIPSKTLIRPGDVLAAARRGAGAAPPGPRTGEAPARPASRRGGRGARGGAPGARGAVAARAVLPARDEQPGGGNAAGARPGPHRRGPPVGRGGGGPPGPGRVVVPP